MRSIRRTGDVSIQRAHTLSSGGRGQGEGAAEERDEAPDLNTFARRLRRDQTPAETLLWSRLRGRRLGGFKFKRQVPIGSYIADFVCSDARLIVELDGGHHNHDYKALADRKRTIELENKHYLVVRFWNHEVTRELDSVCDTILNLAQGA
jgi:very-short-patch-repair endonuclease